ncbi:hypothetical protein D3C84_1176030 [compost metagenome]
MVLKTSFFSLKAVSAVSRSFSSLATNVSASDNSFLAFAAFVFAIFKLSAATFTKSVAFVSVSLAIFRDFSIVS